MNRTFKIVLSVMTVLAFTLLFGAVKAQFGWIILPLLLVALAGALRIIWKMKPHASPDDKNIDDNKA